MTVTVTKGIITETGRRCGEGLTNNGDIKSWYGPRFGAVLTNCK